MSPPSPNPRLLDRAFSRKPRSRHVGSSSHVVASGSILRSSPAHARASSSHFALVPVMLLELGRIRRTLGPISCALRPIFVSSLRIVPSWTSKFVPFGSSFPQLRLLNFALVLTPRLSLEVLRAISLMLFVFLQDLVVKLLSCFARSSRSPHSLRHADETLQSSAQGVGFPLLRYPKICSIATILFPFLASAIPSTCLAHSSREARR